MARERCPVCGCRFRGNLWDHLDKVIKNSGDPGVSRCDWNLIAHRIKERPGRLREEGWVCAGSVVAKVVELLQDTHPHLGMQATSGAVPARPHSYHALAANDLTVWWTRPWVKSLAEVKSWSMRQRMMVIVELDGRIDLKHVMDVVEAAHRIGGSLAVAQLEGGVISARCRAETMVDLQHPDRLGFAQANDWCCRAVAHDGAHLGARYGIPWG